MPRGLARLGIHIPVADYANQLSIASDDQNLLYARGPRHRLEAEMIREIKIAKDGAAKSRRAAMMSLKTVLVNAPAALREVLQPLPNMNRRLLPSEAKRSRT